MEKTLELIDDFYDNVCVEYSNYHNEVTSSSIIKALFKKVDKQAIINKYKELLQKLVEIKDKSVKLQDSVLKDHFKMELGYFKLVLECEINLYTAKDVSPIAKVQYFSDERLKLQKEFSDFDGIFRKLVIQEVKKINNSI